MRHQIYARTRQKSMDPRTQLLHQLLHCLRLRELQNRFRQINQLDEAIIKIVHQMGPFWLLTVEPRLHCPRQGYFTSGEPQQGYRSHLGLWCVLGHLLRVLVRD